MRAWPGNVRELRNEIRRLVALSSSDLDDPDLVRAILRALELSAGDKREAAKLLGISRAKIYQRLKDWGL